MIQPAANSLGAYLRDRRSRLDPAGLGFAVGRRRTPGLRREEVAQRANISTTWYTWLEQGRGGAPSTDVLDRIARGLMLTAPEREHLFVLATGRPPEVRVTHSEGATPRLQRVLDAMGASPAFMKTATWDVVAWNRAAAAILTDYALLPPERRNILRLMFADPGTHPRYDGWEDVARFAVGVLRADAARAGAPAEVKALVAELSRESPEFEAMWRDNSIPQDRDGLKHLNHPALGPIELEFSAFDVVGRPDLVMMVYNPASPEVAERISAYLRRSRAKWRSSSG